MAKTIHAHNILNMLSQSNAVFTQESLAAAVCTKYGSDVRFHTCSKEGLSLSDLLAFFLERGKVFEHQGTLIADPSRICKH